MKNTFRFLTLFLIIASIFLTACGSSPTTPAPPPATAANVPPTTAALTAPSSPQPTATPTPAPNPAPAPVLQSFAISPDTASVRPGESINFTATEAGMTAGDVTWNVGEESGGTITAAGIYTAPAMMGTYHVTAASAADPAKSAVAAVTVADTFTTDNGILLDFTRTQFSYVLNANAGRFAPVLIFQAANTGSTEMVVEVRPTLNGNTTNRPVTQCPRTPIRPGESVFFKYSLEYGWSLGSSSNGPSDYPVGYSGTMKLELTVIGDAGGPNDSQHAMTVPMMVSVSRPTELDLPSGDVRVQVQVQDGSGRPEAGRRVTLANPYAFISEFADSSGRIVFNVAPSPEYWLWVDDNGVQSASIHIDGNNIQPLYNLAVTPMPQWNATAQLVNTVKGKMGFWRASSSNDGAKLLLANGMENWNDPSLAAEAKLYLLDTQTGNVLWTHDIGNQSWSSDLSGDAKYAVVANAGSTPGLPSNAPTFIRLLDARDGSVIWTKALTTLDVPDNVKSNPSFSSMGLKFSHDGSKIFVGLEGCDYSFMLNRADGSVIWRFDAGMHAREAVFTADDNYVYMVPVDGWARKIAVVDGREVWRQFVGGFVFVNGLDLSSDGKYLCTGTKSGDLTLLNTADGSIVFQKHSAAWVMTCRFAPDGKSLIACDSFGGGVYDIAGNQLWYRHISSADERFSADSRWLMATQNYNSAIYDTNGNLVLQVVGNIPGVSTLHVGWLNNDATRYICAAEAYDPSSGAGDVIQIYSLNVMSP